MCYHYAIAKTAAEIAGKYNIKLRLPQVDPSPLFFHVNGFNHNLLPVVYKDVTVNELRLEFMQWGLVPGWVKGEEQALKIRGATLNARAETIDSKPSFRGGFRYRPCLVPASGYFEWMHLGSKKFPFFIHLPDEPCFSFAGIWEEWVNEQTGEILRSFSIVTCEANSLTAKVHNSKKRMPVIIDGEAEDKWIDTKSDKSIRQRVLKPFDPGKMAAFTVGKLITSRISDPNVPEVTDPVTYPELS